MDVPTFDGIYVPQRYQVRSGLSLQPLNFGVEAPAKVCDQGFDIAHLMLNRVYRVNRPHHRHPVQKKIVRKVKNRWGDEI